MLKSDGLTRQQFLPLWHDAMWHAVDPGERTRLLLELGRVTIREEGKVGPLLVAFAEHRDPPFVVIPLSELPTPTEAPGLRDEIRTRLAHMGASEAYLLVVQQVAKDEGEPRYVLVAWGETREDEQAGWMEAFRWRMGELEEAAPMMAPEPERTVLGERCSGLLTTVH